MRNKKQIVPLQYQITNATTRRTKQNQIMANLTAAIQEAMLQFEATYNNQWEARFSEIFPNQFMATDNTGSYLVTVFRTKIHEDRLDLQVKQNAVPPLDRVARAMAFDLINNFIVPITGQEQAPATWEDVELLKKYKKGGSGTPLPTTAQNI